MIFLGTLVKMNAALPPALISSLNSPKVKPRHTKADVMASFGHLQTIITILPKLMDEAPYPYLCGRQKYYRDCDHFLKLCKDGLFFCPNRYHFCNFADTVYFFSFLANILSLPENEVMMPREFFDLEIVESTARRMRGDEHPLARCVKDSLITSPKAYMRLAHVLKDLCHLNMETFGLPADFFAPVANDPKAQAHVAHAHLQRMFNNLKKGEESLTGIFCVVKYFVGAMSGLASVYVNNMHRQFPSKRVDELKTIHQNKQIAMLANLLVLGPSAIFKASTDKEVLADWKGLNLIQFGSELLQDSYKKNPNRRIAPAPFHKLRLHFLRYLDDMGFSKAEQDEFPKVNWEQMIREFHRRFSMDMIVRLLQVDLEVALEPVNEHDSNHRLPDGFQQV